LSGQELLADPETLPVFELHKSTPGCLVFSGDLSIERGCRYGRHKVVTAFEGSTELNDNLHSFFEDQGHSMDLTGLLRVIALIDTQWVDVGERATQVEVMADRLTSIPACRAPLRAESNARYFHFIMKYKLRKV
jgi:hypothetical protein